MSSSTNVPTHIRENYFFVLESICRNADACDYVEQRLNEFKDIILKGGESCRVDLPQAVNDILNRPPRSKYAILKTLLVIDLNKILFEQPKVLKAIESLSPFIPPELSDSLKCVNKNILYKGYVHKKLYWITKSINEIKQNYSFVTKPRKRVMVVANMSAGKSTLLNCLIGKDVLPSSQERCTSNVAYIYENNNSNNKVSYDDGELHLDSEFCDKTKINWANSVDLSLSFTKKSKNNRLCLIDTPGVNSFTEKNHGNITREVVSREEYDVLLYVFSKPGSDEEFSFLRWLLSHVDEKKIIFIMNRADEYRTKEDSISESINGIKADLEKIGFKSLTICPVSSYFGLLLKRSDYFRLVDQDEQEELEFLIKKFSKGQNDLSIYYPEALRYKGENRYKKLLSSCGIYELEQMIF